MIYHPRILNRSHCPILGSLAMFQYATDLTNELLYLSRVVFFKIPLFLIINFFLEKYKCNGIITKHLNFE